MSSRTDIHSRYDRCKNRPLWSDMIIKCHVSVEDWDNGIAVEIFDHGCINQLNVSSKAMARNLFLDGGYFLSLLSSFCFVFLLFPPFLQREAAPQIQLKGLWEALGICN